MGNKGTLTRYDAIVIKFHWGDYWLWVLSGVIWIVFLLLYLTL